MLLLFDPSSERLPLLFTVRSSDLRSHAGQIAFPGGRYEPQDADLLATAVRETREETGVDLTNRERLGSLDDLYPRTPTLPPVIVRPFVFALGLPILGYGFVFKNWWILAVGVVWLMFGMTGWATEPSTETFVLGPSIPGLSGI